MPWHRMRCLTEDILRKVRLLARTRAPDLSVCIAVVPFVLCIIGMAWIAYTGIASHNQTLRENVCPNGDSQPLRFNNLTIDIGDQ